MSENIISLEYYTNQMQRYCDKVAGLKVKNSLLAKENKQLKYENNNLTSSLEKLREENCTLQKDYDNLLKQIECNDDTYKFNNNSLNNMISFKKAFDDYEEYKNKIYDDIDTFLSSPYKGFVDIYDSDFDEDDDDLTISITPYDDTWIKEYHNEFCDKFNLKLHNTRVNHNRKIIYNYRLK